MTIIRFAATADAADLVAIYTPAVRDRATSFELEPPDATEMARRVANAVRTPWLVCEEEATGRVIGYAYAGTFRERPAYQWSVEVSAYVHEDYHRRGIGRGLYTALFMLLVHQGFRTTYAGVTLPNQASVALHESMGFAPLGVFHHAGYKHGHWHDVAWFERFLTTHDGEPEPPLPISVLEADAAFAGVIKEAFAAGVRSSPTRESF